MLSQILKRSSQFLNPNSISPRAISPRLWKNFPIKQILIATVSAAFITGCASGNDYSKQASNQPLTQSPNYKTTKVKVKKSARAVTNNASSPQFAKAGPSNQKIWQDIRAGFTMPDLYNEEVIAKEQYYSSRPDYMERMTNRSANFIYHVQNEVRRRGMPSELALLPFVESAYVTSATSSASAQGLWQIMPRTGDDLGLQQNRFIDQRNDVVASTNAALNYLQGLYNEFGDWHLALAAYNWGQGNVRKAIRTAQANGLMGTYEDIRMPTETRQYVPKLQALKNIVKSPATYGIYLPNIEELGPTEYITATRDIDISTAARMAGISVEEFRRLNAAHKFDTIFVASGAQLVVPRSKTQTFYNAFRDPSTKLANWTTYVTNQSETIDQIAQSRKVSPSLLKAVNNIPNYHDTVLPYSSILVPRAAQDKDASSYALSLGLNTTGSAYDFNTFGGSVDSSSFGFGSSVPQYPIYTPN